MGFRDPIIGGTGTLIRQAIKSPNYSAGSAGWSINKDGTAEFSDVTLRGSLATTGSGTRIEIGTNGNDEISFYDSNDDYGKIEVGTGKITMTAPYFGEAEGWKFAEYSYNSMTHWGSAIQYQPTKDPTADEINFTFWANTEWANQLDDGTTAVVVHFRSSSSGGFLAPNPGDGTTDETWEIKAGKDGVGGANLFRIQKFPGSENGVYVTNGSNFVMYGNVLQSLSSSTFTLRSNVNNIRLQRGSSTSTTLDILSNSISLGGNIQGIAYNGTTGTGSPNKIGFKWSSPNFYGRVDNVVSAVIGTVSDARLKGDVRPLTGAVARLKKLKPKDFLPIDLEGNPTLSPRRPGLIAQDVELVEPWAVPTVTGEDEYKTVDYLGLVALLVQAINELAERLPSNESE